MSGTKVLLDTNALIAYLQGSTTLEKIGSFLVLLPIISVIAFLAFRSITDTDKKLLFELISEVPVLELKKDETRLIELISSIPVRYKIKLPDAIIAGMALHNNATLITNDKGFSKIDNLKILTF